MGKQKKQKYYAIKEGNGVKNRIFTTWEECEKLVKGYPAVYKSFLTEKEAFEYLGTVNVEKVKEQTIWGMEAKKNNKGSKAKKGSSLNVKLPAKLLEEFESKCKQMDISQEKIIKGMIEEWLL